MENHEANQAAFDKVVRHLLKQGEKSYRRPPSDGMSGDCAYRGQRGLQCAIGCLIPDAEYDRRMDVEAAGTGRLLRRFDPPSLRGLNASLLANLQKVHDCAPVHSWLRELAFLADLYGLTMPDLEQQP